MATSWNFTSFWPVARVDGERLDVDLAAVMPGQVAAGLDRAGKDIGLGLGPPAGLPVPPKNQPGPAPPAQPAQSQSVKVAGGSWHMVFFLKERWKDR